MSPHHQLDRDRRPRHHAMAGGCFVLLALALASPSPAASSRVILTPAAGFSITWDGNNGGFSSPDAGAGPGDNVALATHGTVPFGSSEFGGGGIHLIANVNDGLYGNSHSWIANFVLPDPAPFIGLRFPASVNVSSLAWSRDNGDTSAGEACGGTCRDRNVGVYTLQYTTADNPDANTAETGDAATGWATIGTIEYTAGTDDISFSGYLRHRFDLAQGGSPIAATGLRIKVSDPNIDIDEIEVNPLPDPIPPITNFLEITPAAGFSILWDRNEGKHSTSASPAPVPENDASRSRGAVAFGSSEVNLGVHFIANVNDGLYGNAHSWIPDFVAQPDPAPFIGIKFGRRVLVRNLAWGRDNGDIAGDCCGGTLTDRTLGLYVIQVTTAANPGLSTPEACGPAFDSGWVTVGTIRYKSDDPTYFNSYLRHRFDLVRDGNPIAATAIRIKVPSNQSDIDEIEVNANAPLESDTVGITNAPGLQILWDGNDGQFSDPAAGAAPPPNRALASEGTIPFTSSDLGPVLGIPFHRAVNLNDGLYGNAHSWISAGGLDGASDPDPFAGLNFGGTVAVTNIAWGRDNGDSGEGTFMDRVVGTYRLQYTTVPAPDATTPDTADAATGWADIGSVTYTATPASGFTPFLRHRFDISAAGGPLQATGIRIKVSSAFTDLDEIEVNTSTTAPPAPAPVVLSPAAGYAISWDGNNGLFSDGAAGAAPPPNRALAAAGTTPFTSSDLGPSLGLPFHRAFNLNDGLYGNAHSWICAGGLDGTTDPDPFAGLNFGGSVLVTNIAWSRDNGDSAEGTFVDRVFGVYTLQITLVSDPDANTPDTGDPATGWTTVGTVEYRTGSAEFTPHLRHRFDLAAGGAPIEATGLRLKISNRSLDLDEIEVNTDPGAPLPHLTGRRSGDSLVLSWTGGGGLEYADSLAGPWACLPDAAPGYAAPLGAPVSRYYRVRR